jgi:nucleoside-diphosphate-sugar epimerase
MRYEFTQPFLVDSTKAETRLGLSATPLDDAVSQTVSWFRHRSSAK